MHWPQLKCPFCGATLPNRQYHANAPSICPGCNRKLGVANWYQNLFMLIGVAITLTGCWLLGLRAWRLLLGTLVAFFPVCVFTVFAVAQLFPPPLTLWHDEKPAEDENLFPPSIMK